MDTYKYELQVKIVRGKDITSGRLSYDIMEDYRKWNIWAGTLGRGNWALTQYSRKSLKDYILRQPGAEIVIHELTTWGYQPDTGCWIMGGTCIESTGKAHKVIPETPITMMCSDGEERSFIVDQSKFGFTIPDLPYVSSACIGTTGTGFHEIRHLAKDKPYDYTETEPLERRAAFQAARMAISDVAEAMHDNLGTHAGLIGLGYMMAHNVSHAAYKERHCFPHLYIHGRWQAGKDTFARTMAAIVGIPEASVVKAGLGSTAKGLRNELGYGCGWPAWINEIERKTEHDYLKEWIKNGYDRQGTVVTNTKQQRVSYPIRRSLMLVGQSVLGNDAEMSRYVALKILPYSNRLAFARVRMCISAAKKAWATLLCDNGNAAHQIMTALPVCEEYLKKNAMADDRRSYAWGLVMAAVAWLKNPVSGNDPIESIDVDVLAEIIERCQNSMQHATSLGALGSFWIKAETLHAAGKLPNAGPSRWIQRIGKDALAVWVSHVVESVAAQNKDVDRELVYEELSFHNSCRQKNLTVSMSWRGDSGRAMRYSRRCFIFDETSEIIPNWAIQSIEGGNASTASITDGPFEEINPRVHYALTSSVAADSPSDL